MLIAVKIVEPGRRRVGATQISGFIEIACCNVAELIFVIQCHFRRRVRNDHRLRFWQQHYVYYRCVRFLRMTLVMFFSCRHLCKVVRLESFLQGR